MGIGYAAQQRCMSSSSLDNNKWVKEGTRVNPAEPIYLINFLYNTLWIIFQLKMLCCVVIAWQERLTRIDTHSEYGMEFYCHLSRRVQIKIATKGNKCQEEGGWVYGNALHFPIPIGIWHAESETFVSKDRQIFLVATRWIWSGRITRLNAILCQDYEFVHFHFS